MKTLLFSPLFLDGPERYDRNVQWRDFLTLSMCPHLMFDELFYVDNGSDEKLLERFENGFFLSFTIEKHKTRLLRNTQHGYGYWYYAFARAIAYAKKNNYDRIVHIDTDIYLLNKKICSFINGIHSGWSTFWCPFFNLPECMMQIICKDQFDSAEEFYTRDFLKDYPDKISELIIPFTNIYKDWTIDRYGERNLPQAPDMDAYVQKPNHIKLKFND